MALSDGAFPLHWRPARRVFRAVLGLVCLGTQLLASKSFLSSKPDLSLVTIFTAIFALFSLVLLLWSKLDRFQMSIAVLFIEAAFFIVFSVYGSDASGIVCSFLFLYLMVSAVYGHGWGDVAIVETACLGFYAFVRAPDSESVRRIVIISGFLACFAALQKRKLENQIGDAGRRENQLRGEAEKVRAAERQRVAGDFHDGPLQTFIAMQVRLDVLGTLLKRDRDTGMADLKEIQDLAKQIVADVRSFLRDMMPVESDDGDLLSSARRIVEYFQKDTGIAARFVSTESAIYGAPEMARETLQILREALHNVQKHSKAARVAVTLEQTGKTVEMSIDDDGAGFSFSGSFSLDELDLLRLGPQSIKRRVRGLGGELTLESRPGHGSGLKIRLPA
ncbi:MAG: sensor histidine kinase [Bryobacteraceae bacterium]